MIVKLMYDYYIFVYLSFRDDSYFADTDLPNYYWPITICHLFS